MAKDTRTYSQVTNLPDQATQAFRGAIFPSLAGLAGRTPSVYGATWNPSGGQPLYNSDGTPRLDPVNNQPMFEGSFDRDPSVPLTAGTNADIEAANAQVRAGQGVGQFGLDRGGANIANAAGMDIYGAGAPAYGQAGQYYNQAASVNTAGQYQPYGAAATNLYGQSTDALGLSSASPYLQAAGQSSVQNINQYMNPYNEQVTNRIAQLGARNLSENILPSISSDFIKAGGYGSTRQRDLVGRAARDTQEAILGQQAQALQSGYSEGLTTSAADKLRYGSLANTAGNLGTQQQQNLQTAARGISDIGNNLSTLYGSDATRKIAAGQGQAGIGAGLGNLMQANQQGQLAVGQANIGLGQTAQQMNLRDVAALQAVGESGQAQQQRVIDANRGQVAAENAAPFYNVGQASSNAAGVPAGGSTGSTTTSTPSPSAASQIGGLAVGALGTYNALNKAKGGAIKKGSLKKASYGKLPKRGLSMFARAS